MFGPAFAMKGGLSTATYRVPGTTAVVGAIAAVGFEALEEAGLLERGGDPDLTVDGLDYVLGLKPDEDGEQPDAEALDAGS